MDQASFKPSSSNKVNIPKSNCFNLLANKNGLGGDPLDANQPIKLMNTFDSLLLEEQFEPYEDCEIHGEDLTSF